MPRPKKCRRVCQMPPCRVFEPQGGGQRETLVMTVDEYETVRLMDRLGYTQEQCAQQMNISRPTVTGIYESARRKLAEFLLGGRALRIEGGDFALCPHGRCGCAQRGCCHHVHCKLEEKTHENCSRV